MFSCLVCSLQNVKLEESLPLIFQGVMRGHVISSFILPPALCVRCHHSLLCALSPIGPGTSWLERHRVEVSLTPSQGHPLLSSHLSSFQLLCTISFSTELYLVAGPGTGTHGHFLTFYLYSNDITVYVSFCSLLFMYTFT